MRTTYPEEGEDADDAVLPKENPELVLLSELPKLNPDADPAAVLPNEGVDPAGFDPKVNSDLEPSSVVLVAFEEPNENRAPPAVDAGAWDFSAAAAPVELFDPLKENVEAEGIELIEEVEATLATTLVVPNENMVLGAVMDVEVAEDGPAKENDALGDGL